MALLRISLAENRFKYNLALEIHIHARKYKDAASSENQLRRRNRAILVPLLTGKPALLQRLFWGLGFFFRGGPGFPEPSFRRRGNPTGERSRGARRGCPREGAGGSAPGQPAAEVQTDREQAGRGGPRPLRAAGSHPGLGCTGGGRGTGARARGAGGGSWCNASRCWKTAPRGLSDRPPRDRGAPCSLRCASLKGWCRGCHPGKQGTDRGGPPS